MTRKEVYLQQNPGAATYPDGTPKGFCCCIEGLAVHCPIKGKRRTTQSRRKQCAECWAMPAAPAGGKRCPMDRLFRPCIREGCAWWCEAAGVCAVQLLDRRSTGGF